MGSFVNVDNLLVLRQNLVLGSILEHVYEVRPRKDQCAVDLVSAALPFGRLWYGEQNAISNAIS